MTACLTSLSESKSLSSKNTYKYDSRHWKAKWFKPEDLSPPPPPSSKLSDSKEAKQNETAGILDTQPELCGYK